MERDRLKTFETVLLGQSLSVTRRESDWSFELVWGLNFAISVPWRIVADGRIAFASADDGRQFGLPAPIDGEAEVRSLLNSKRIVAATVNRQTADLKLVFDSNAELDAFNNSIGYEGWQAQFMCDGKSTTLVALGGGGVAFYGEDGGFPV